MNQSPTLRSIDKSQFSSLSPNQTFLLLTFSEASVGDLVGGSSVAVGFSVAETVEVPVGGTTEDGEISEDTVWLE